MIGNVHQKALGNIIGLFDRPIIQNSLRGTYIEYVVAELLGSAWRVTSSDWSSWDLQHKDGTALEVKQSACKQTWRPSENGYSSPTFSIRTPKTIWSGAVSKPGGKRPASIYVFAWHGNDTRLSDQRDTSQWLFYVLPEHELPNQKTIRLSSLEKLAQPLAASDLSRRIEAIRQGDMQ